MEPFVTMSTANVIVFPDLKAIRWERGRKGGDTSYHIQPHQVFTLKFIYGAETEELSYKTYQFQCEEQCPYGRYGQNCQQVCRSVDLNLFIISIKLIVFKHFLHLIYSCSPSMMFAGVRTGPGVIRLTEDVRVPLAGGVLSVLSEPAPDQSSTALTAPWSAGVIRITPKCEFKVEQTAPVSISRHFNFLHTCLLVWEQSKGF